MRHRSKKFVFIHECGGCGKTLRRNSKNKLGYLCRKCRPLNRNTHDNKFICQYCPFELDCTARVQLGTWVRCETPDIGDLERLKFSGGLNDERVRAELESALAGGGSRKILEEAVSESAQKIYQDVLTRI